MARLTVVTLAIAVAAFLLVLELLRRRKLREKYAALWVVVAGLAVLLSIFPGLLNGAAALLGIAVPSNLLFLMSLLVLFAVSLQLSREVGMLEEQTRRLAEEVGALRLHLDRIERDRRAPKDETGDPAGSEDIRSDSPDPGAVGSRGHGHQ